MKDSEFIELLNLYLDHEISPADAARLEAEVQSNPERRSIYQQYCRMQKACTMLAKDFGDQPAIAAESRKVVAFEPSRRSTWSPGTFAVGGLMAAAACIALVLVNRQAETAGAGQGAIAQSAVPSAANLPAVGAGETNVLLASANQNGPQAQMARMVTMPVPHRNELHPVLATRALALASSASGLDAHSAGELPAQLDWISGLKIAPMQRVQVEDLRFEARPSDAAKNPIYGSRNRPALQGVVEMTAFQFQK